MWSFIRQRVTTSLIRNQLYNDSSSIRRHKKTVEDLAKTPTNQLIQCVSTSDRKGDGNYNYKKKKTCNGQQDFYPQYDCSLLETVGWVGTALAISLNFKLCHKVPIDRDQVCQKPLICKGVINFLWGVVSALPTKSVTKLALPEKSSSTSLDEKRGESSTTSPQPILESLNATRKNLEAISQEYFGHLETIAGLEAVEKDSKKGLFHFEEGSRLGNAKAHFNLGVCYETGQGTEIDLQKAAFHYGEASKADHPMASYNLGIFYLEGKGNLSQNFELGLELIDKAANLGLIEAKTYMGIYYFEKSNWNKAFTTLKEASVKDAEAQYYLSCCYKYGLGVKPNAELAEKYFNLSSSSGFDQCIDWIANEEITNADIPTTDFVNSEKPNLFIQSSLHTSTSSPELSPNTPNNKKNVYDLAISRYLDIILPNKGKDPNVSFTLGDTFALDKLDCDTRNLEFLSMSDKLDNSLTLSKVNNIMFVR